MAEGTFANEATLPRVPLPGLEPSCRRFLEWCAPLLTADELAETEAATTEFLRPDSPAHALHEALTRYDASDGVHSWLDEFWRDRYLGRRDRIALNANYFFLFTEGEKDQVRRAAQLTAAAVDYKLAIDAESVAPSMQRGRPLSMAQHKHLFSTTRIPGEQRDTVRTPYTDDRPWPTTAGHIIVLVRGAMYRVDALGPTGRRHTVDELADALRDVQARAPQRGQCVGHLTTKARAEWARSRTALLAHDDVNRAALEDVESALFCVCLDDVAPDGIDDACAHLLTGDSGNRWFDKAVSFVVFADGTAGINGEHCELDGTTVAELIDAVLSGDYGNGADPQGNPVVTPVEFALDDALTSDLAAAGADFAEYARSNAMRYHAVDGFGSDVAKRLGVSPDAFAQLAFQLAHRRVKGFTGATYESISMRKYHYGRTEAMRVITPEMVRFVDAMDDPAADRTAKVAALQAAAQAHVARAKQCQASDAPEQLLWELLLLHRRQGATDTPSLYESPGWRVMRDDYLSTSAVPSGNIRCFGFGATSEHCIGVSYLMMPAHFSVYLATPSVVSDQMYAFADALTSAISELVDLLEAS